MDSNGPASTTPAPRHRRIHDPDPDTPADLNGEALDAYRALPRRVKEGPNVLTVVQTGWGQRYPARNEVGAYLYLDCRSPTPDYAYLATHM